MPAELGVMLGSTVAMTLTVWFGSKWSRWIGGVKLVDYIVWLVSGFIQSIDTKPKRFGK